MNDPVLNKFDPANAAALCAASARAYIESTVDDPATDTHVLISRPDHSAVSREPSSLDAVVSFRGTADLRNWLTDLDCAWDLEDGARIHRGFARALDSVSGQITAEVVSALNQGRRVWLTGHSLGGALAMLFAWRFFASYHECPFSGVYTFGQPRVGNAHFRDLYDFSGLKCRTFRVVHADDIVPRVPWLLGSYRHAGQEIFFPSSSSRASWLTNPPLASKLPNDLRNAWRELRCGKLALLADHHVNTYLELFQPKTPHQPINLHIPVPV